MSRSTRGEARGGAAGNDPYRVMVVDDSAVVRGMTTRFLERDNDIQIVSSVGDGQRAISQLDRHAPVDVVVLDIEMPVMDGLTALPKLLEKQGDVQVLVSSTLTKSNADISLKALRAGAADYVTKPGNSGLHTADEFQEELRSKVKTLGAARRRSAGGGKAGGASARERPGPATDRASVGSSTAARTGRDKPASAPAASAAPATVQKRAASNQTPEVIAIGSSTGGPQALFQVLTELGPVRQPILVTQHMPKTFTALLADHIKRQTKLDAIEVAGGESLVGGRVHVAPGGSHMVVERGSDGLHLKLSDDPPENFCKPSVDPMLRSLATVFGGRLLTVILTGMGHDGYYGCQTVVQAGGQVIAQDEESSVVWGMPGAVAKAGLCSAVLPLGEIADHMRKIAMRSAA
ncbi:two-component system, chemotaxis family, response regulator CheB [Limimonas halophila]|uniref:Protein-glutamate methylesterase/protein-glutamine glutaminase n=1 Tax=Limimonas halophila TaxID=1082479 RepID=A0A1G7M2R6_9PROT|nr:chemotaxis response regulator protein-glutamate methylesterase [Limimonas halophila]SDF56092.1 two-component system, chemotaxis family, response regulator CheB [Limimonas halophila]